MGSVIHRMEIYATCNVDVLSLVRPWQSGRRSARRGHYHGSKGEVTSALYLTIAGRSRVRAAELISVKPE